MNSNEYLEISLFFTPFDEEYAYIIEAELSDLPYDSFMIDETEGVQPCLKAYIGKEDYDPRALKLVLSALERKVTFSANMVPPQNWNLKWEQEFTPIVIGSDVLIRSLNHSDDDIALARIEAGVKSRRSRYNIKINPQMAFGTGHHETTRMMIRSMIARKEESISGKVILDMGCGTGILGILAVKMGAKRAYGIDIDAVAAQSAFDNAYLNRVSRRFETYYGDASLLQMGKYDTILANIHRNIILQDLRTHLRSLRKGGTLILSGFYDSDCADIISEAEKLSPGISAERTLTEKTVADGKTWACITLVTE